MKIDLKQLGAKFSKSEKSGISLLTDNDLMIFCPGISTGGFAEITMAEKEDSRKVIATTIDQMGLMYTKELIKKSKLQDRVKLKIEDIRNPMPYKSNFFDFIYARLVLHYLSKNDLDKTLREFFRVLKNGGRLFVVVRSNKDCESKLKGSLYNKDTKMTTYPVYNSNLEKTNKKASRYFHSKKSISTHLKNAGFQIEYTREYNEQLYHGYMRTIPAPKLSPIIETLAKK